MLTWIIDAILFAMPIEGLAFWLFHRRTGRGIPVSRLVGNLGAGFFLLLAVRVALAPSISRETLDKSMLLCLLLALLCHIADLAGRWRD